MRLQTAFLSVLLFLTTPITPQEEFLFESGRITHRQNNNGKKSKHRSIHKNLKFIDQHLFPRAVDVKVQVNGVGMPHLYEGAVKSLPLLKGLHLPKCGIKTIAPQAFKNLPRIERIFLQENYIQDIEEGVFNNLPLVELFLQRNKIRLIRSGAFDNMPHLTTIKLNSNKITQWDINWFKNAPMLSEVYFRRNRIQEIPARAFTNLKPSHKVHDEELVDLKIFLSKNKISHVSPDAFKGLDSLYQIWLDRNQIRELDRNLFSHMTELEGVYLQKNRLTSVDKFMFKNIEEMSNFDVSRNNLTCIPYEIVSLVEAVIVEGNNMMDCNCIYNLRTKLTEDGKDNKIIDNKDCAFD